MKRPIACGLSALVLLASSSFVLAASTLIDDFTTTTQLDSLKSRNTVGTSSFIDDAGTNIITGTGTAGSGFRDVFLHLDSLSGSGNVTVQIAGGLIEYNSSVDSKGRLGLTYDNFTPGANIDPGPGGALVFLVNPDAAAVTGTGMKITAKFTGTGSLGSVTLSTTVTTFGPQFVFIPFTPASIPIIQSLAKLEIEFDPQKAGDFKAGDFKADVIGTQVIPEPSAIALAASALLVVAGCVVMRRRFAS